MLLVFMDFLVQVGILQVFLWRSQFFYFIVVYQNIPSFIVVEVYSNCSFSVQILVVVLYAQSEDERRIF